MTTVPMRNPFPQSAYLYDGQQLVTLIRCKLSPWGVPAWGGAQVPEGRDWLAHTDRIVPTKLDRAPDARAVLHFGVVS
jgi:hypothetical protein